mmetsp:Transcript_17317/g.32805  ORF Transcript_17317/g.32805 Transcript_17317/m.32805 type:complete len:399 (-) Transcript_17317:87-1283(-)|eukprot:CAMPEP_0176491194 /NCGR_PEP_ID=MMETSP0200_2-20121128/8297_1 /TAXON_ID=947934 /ORGANISM="Chaetoceros sp., Strain GSL56" /LENGTH=398 /DNA_ID=CAMNT_0017888597 /DNA_START=79 /DNA_END=1275 /DNA_ORIENTATION=+
MSLTPATKRALNSLVEEHMTSVIRDSITMQRHTKRPRRTLHSSSVNLALACLQRSTASVTNTPLVSKQTNNNVDLNSLLSCEIPIPPPVEIGLTLHWLAVDGVQPTSLLNPQEEQMKSVRDRRETLDDESRDSSSIALRQLLPRLVSDELQLYFSRITHALSSHPEAAISRLANDSGIQELVPFFTRFITRTIHQNMNNSEQCRLIVQCIDALIRNRNIHLELHLDQLLPSILTCIVAKRIGSVGDNHWLLRDEASQVLVRTCALFGEKYGNLRGKVIQTLCKALELQGEGDELGRWYGGIVGLTMFGRSAVESFVLPLLEIWVTWETALKVSDGEILFGLERCQDAFLFAMSVYFKGMNSLESSKLLDYEKISEVFGNQVIPLLQLNASSDYATCFV